jgi:hypothetical protein
MNNAPNYNRNGANNDDELLGGNMNALDDLGEVGKPDWMESDSSDDGKLVNNRNNFDLGRPVTRKLIDHTQKARVLSGIIGS